MYDNHQYFTQASNTKYKLLLNSYFMILYRGTLVKLSVWYMQHLFDIYDCFLEISIASWKSPQELNRYEYPSLSSAVDYI